MNEEAQVAGDVMAGTIRSSTCPKCGETFQRPQDRDVHLERHRPAPQLSKEDREGMVHCPKGCGRWLVPSEADTEAHAMLCDGARPILDKREKIAYRWWCEAHGFGTDGPKAWGQHKREHHGGNEPVKKANEPRRKEGVEEIMRLLRAEAVRVEGEIARQQMALVRVKAALAALEENAKPGVDA
jgi:hypothetical protein